MFLACTLAGALWEPAGVWQLVDLCNALMALPNLAALLLLAPQSLRTLSCWKAEQRPAPRRPGRQNGERRRLL